MISIDDYDNIVDNFENDERIDSMKDVGVFAIKNAKDTVMLCIRPKRDDNVLARDFLDLQLYVRIDVDFGTIVIAKDNLSCTELTEDELFDVAENNSRHTMTVNGLGTMLGIDDDDYPKVLMCNGGCYGGIAMKFVEDAFNSDMYILPSSVHEVIAIPVEEDDDVDKLKEMVESINSTFVDEEDKLSDNVYKYTHATGEISVC